ncbi:hypothetical protein [Paenibacillus bovis]|nr:hypothetical protein [Paenibacillus bovis]
MGRKASFEPDTRYYYDIQDETGEIHQSGISGSGHKHKHKEK